MLDTAEITRRLSEMDNDATDVLREDRHGNHETFWRGMDTRGRNLERLYRLSTGAELEARIRKLEEGGAHGGPDPTEAHSAE